MLKTRKHILAITVLIISSLFLTGCFWSTAPEPEPEPELEPVGMSTEEYRALIAEINLEIEESEKAAYDVDYTNPDEIQTYVDSSKEAYAKLIGIDAPEELMQAQEMFDSGARKMIEYFNKLQTYLQMEDGGDEQGEEYSALVDIYSAALVDLAKANSQMSAGDAPIQNE